MPHSLRAQVTREFCTLRWLRLFQRLKDVICTRLALVHAHQAGQDQRRRQKQSGLKLKLPVTHQGAIYVRALAAEGECGTIDRTVAQRDHIARLATIPAQLGNRSPVPFCMPVGCL